MNTTRPLFVALTALLMASCQQGPAPDEGARELPQGPPPGEVAIEVPQSPTPTRLTSDGWRELRIGMTREQVVATLGDDANPEAVGGADPEQCDQFRPERAPEGMLVMIEQGRLTRISLSDGAGVETEGGIEVGDSASAVRRMFATRAVPTPHKYLPAPAEYLTVWTTEPPGPDARGVVYEVGVDGRLIHIHAGGPSVQYVEGCL